MKKIKNLVELFLVFLKIGIITFGGGYVMISIIQNQMVEIKKWFTKDEFLKIITISQSLPGPLSVTSATYFGYKRAGLIGSFLAILGIVLPAFITILLIAIFIRQFQSNTYIKAFLKGIQAGVSVLVLKAAFRLSKPIKYSLYNFLLITTTIVVILVFNFNLIIVLLFFIVVSYLKLFWNNQYEYIS